MPIPDHDGRPLSDHQRALFRADLEAVERDHRLRLAPGLSGLVRAALAFRYGDEMGAWRELHVGIARACDELGISPREIMRLAEPAQERALRRGRTGRN